MKRFAAFLLVFLLLGGAAASAYDNVPSWALESGEFEAAASQGLIPAMLNGADMSAGITRLEFCAIALQLFDVLTGTKMPDTLATPFSDIDDGTASAAHALGIVGGYPDGTFLPDRQISRQEMFKMLHNLLSAVGETPDISDIETQNRISVFDDSGLVQSWALESTAFVLAAGIVNGSAANGRLYIDPEGAATRAQSVIMAYRFNEFFAEPEPAIHIENTQGGGAAGAGVLTPGTALTTWGYDADTAAKMEYIFGSADSEKYSSHEEAVSDMEWVAIQVWTLLEDGGKTPSSMQIQVHKKLAPTVLQIFTEIFEGDEKFPIKDVGCYAWRESNSKSEHKWGLAIDINYNENYYINTKTGDTVGELWDPETSPYSIPPDGDVVRIFHKYGFGWGGDGWWSSVLDYMHFSFMST